MWSDDPRFYTWDGFLQILAGLGVIAAFAGLLYGIRTLQRAWAKEHRTSKRLPWIALLAALILVLVALVYWLSSGRSP